MILFFNSRPFFSEIIEWEKRETANIQAYTGIEKKNKSEKERKMSKPNSAENTLKQLYQTTLLLYQFACDPFKKCVHLLFSSLFFYRIFVLYLSFETSSFFLDRNSFYLYSQKFLRLAKALWII